MSIVSFSIKRKITLTMIYILAVGFGLFSLSQLKVAMTPDIDFPVVLILTNYPGASAEDVENLISRPVESGVSVTENVQTIRSQSSNGTSMVTLEFAWGSDMKQAENDVRTSLDMVRDILPPDASEPIVFAINPSMFPIMMLSIDGENITPSELRQLGDDRIVPLLERVPGVASVYIQGGQERQINVNLNPILMASHSISIQQVVQAISGGGGIVSSGSLRTDAKEFNLRVFSEYLSVEDIADIPLTRGASPVLLRHVAEVVDGHKELAGDVRINSREGLALFISKQSDANTVQVANAVRSALPRIRSSISRDISFNSVYDSAEFTEKSIANLGNTAGFSFIVVVIVIYLFLRNRRGSFIMALSMPISVIITFAVLYQAGLTLNVISMAGLALAIGMLVDNSIVVLENIFRHRELDESIESASERGAIEVSTPIVASTLTTISVFIPVLFVPGMTGQLFREMVLTITFSLSVSLVVALTLVPMLSASLLKWKREDKKSDGRIFGWISKKYGSLLHWSVRHKKTVIALTILAFIGSIMLMPFVGGEFMPANDEGRISLTVETAPGTPLSTLRQLTLQLEEIVQTHVPEATNMMFEMGEQGGFSGGSNNTVNATINLGSRSERERSQEEIEIVLRGHFDDIPGITTSFNAGGMGGSGAPIELKIFGDNISEVRFLAEELRYTLAGVDGFVDVRLNVSSYLPQLDIHLDRVALREYGIGSLETASLLSTAMHGQRAGRYRESGNEFDIYVQFASEFRSSREDIGAIPISLPSGGIIPFRELATIEEGESPATIYRENQQRYIAIEANLAGLDLSSAREAVERVLSETAIPSDITTIIGGTAEDQQEANFYMLLAFIVAVILVYMVMASQFESLIDPMIIMGTVPLSIIGVILMLFVTGTPLSLMALVGVVMLVGIAVNNGIVLVDYMNYLHKSGQDLYSAAEQGGVVRLRPVLMTAVTTAVGMIPMAMELGDGAETWAPLARAVIGGLLMTTILTLVVIPVVYILFEEWGERLKNLLKRIFFGGAGV